MDVSGTAVVVLKKGRDRPVRRRHPWVFSGSVEQVRGEPGPGFEGPQGGRSQVLGVGVPKHTSPVAERRPDGVDDDRLCHD